MLKSNRKRKENGPGYLFPPEPEVTGHNYCSRYFCSLQTTYWNNLHHGNMQNVIEFHVYYYSAGTCWRLKET